MGRRNPTSSIRQSWKKVVSCSWEIVSVFFVLVIASPLAVARQTTDKLCLARDGKALARIVVGENSTKVVNLAAQELRDYLNRITGAKFAVVAKAEDSPRIFLGDCPEARNAGFDVSTLKRDGFFRAVAGEDLYILGRDDPAKGRYSRIPPAATHAWHIERATLFGVYDFLEDVCGVQWFMPGPKGEVVPTLPNLHVPRGSLKEEPVFEGRSVSQFEIFHYRYPDKKNLEYTRDDVFMWALRMRYQTQNSVPGCHSSYYLKFGDRFGKEHPEWFALLENGTRAIETQRGNYLCYSSGVLEEYIKDARAYFSGESAASRGLDSRSLKRVGYDNRYFVVDPNDAYPGCHCKNCQRVLKEYPETGFEEIVFGFVAKVADGIKDLKGKKIVTLAYPPKLLPPQTVTLPENVNIRLCISGPNASMLKKAHQAQMKLLKDWHERIGGNLFLWLYPNVSHYLGHLDGAVEVEPHVMSKFFREVQPYIKGIFYENESLYATYRMLDMYIFFKLAWDPNADVDALLNDFFTNFFGPASGPMNKFYTRLEKDWKKIMTFYPEPDGYLLWRARPFTVPGRLDLWEEIYNEKELKILKDLLNEAEKKASGNEIYAWRVNMIRENLYANILKHRQKYIDTMGKAFKDIIKSYHPRTEIKVDGKLEESIWKDVKPTMMVTRGKAEKPDVATGVWTSWDKENLYVAISCQEPEMRNTMVKKGRVHDDPQIWKDNDVEIFIGQKRGAPEYCQILINEDGIFSDNRRSKDIRGGKSIWSWDCEGEIETSRYNDKWTVEAKIPFRSFLDKLPSGGDALLFNVVRYRVLKEGKPSCYSLSTVGSWNDTTGFSKLQFVDSCPERLGENLIKNGDFEKVQTFWSTPPNKEFPAEWAAAREQGARIQADREVKWSGESSLRLHNDEKVSACALQYLPVLKPDTKYRFSCYVKTENVQQAKLGKYPNVLGVSANLYVPGANRYIPNPAIRGTTDWRKIIFTVRTATSFPEKPVQYLRLWIKGASGTAWFDDVKVQKMLE